MHIRRALQTCLRLATFGSIFCHWWCRWINQINCLFHLISPFWWFASRNCFTGFISCFTCTCLILSLCDLLINATSHWTIGPSPCVLVDNFPGVMIIFLLDMASNGDCRVEPICGVKPNFEFVFSCSCHHTATSWVSTVAGDVVVLVCWEPWFFFIVRTGDGSRWGRHRLQR